MSPLGDVPIFTGDQGPQHQPWTAVTVLGHQNGDLRSPATPGQHPYLILLPPTLPDTDSSRRLLGVFPSGARVRTGRSPPARATGLLLAPGQTWHGAPPSARPPACAGRCGNSAFSTGGRARVGARPHAFLVTIARNHPTKNEAASQLEKQWDSCLPALPPDGLLRPILHTGGRLSSQTCEPGPVAPWTPTCRWCPVPRRTKAALPARPRGPCGVRPAPAPTHMALHSRPQGLPPLPHRATWSSSGCGPAPLRLEHAPPVPDAQACPGAVPSKGPP